jgi:hypothetical protein
MAQDTRAVAAEALMLLGLHGAALAALVVVVTVENTWLVAHTKTPPRGL